MAGNKLMEMLNMAVARELQVSIQYMWQNVEAKGIRGVMVRGIFRKTAITEMLHAETIADRLAFMGGKPTTKPDMITVGENFDEMLSEDIKSEEEAVKIYREIIVLADNEGDIVTRKLFENILVDEEKHLDDFRTLLGD